MASIFKIALAVVGTLILSSIGPNPVEARTWNSVKIDGAKCGNGSDYQVYLSQKDPKKIAFYFQGGGACWSNLTCNGPLPLTLLWIPSVIPEFSFLSDQPTSSPIADYTVVYFPYCTGDVFSGAHSANYGAFSPAWVHHWGATNVGLAMQLLTQSDRIRPMEAEKTVTYGISAGGIGALLNLSTLEPFIGPQTKKIAILDSPGLHFESSWLKALPEPLLADLNRALSQAGVEAGVNLTEVAKAIPQVCQRFNDWKIGILQGSQDFIMSVVFGGLWPSTHEKRVYGPNGILHATGPGVENCSSWVPRSLLHGFFITDWTGGIKAGGLTAHEYARQLIEDSPISDNYR